MVAVQRRLDALEARHQDTQEQDQAPGRIMTALIRINAAIDYLIMRPKIIEPTSEPSPGNEQRRIASSQRLLPKPRD